MSRIALACFSESSNFLIRPSRASSGSFEARISLITASRLSSATSSPSRMCARASARRSWYWVRRGAAAPPWAAGGGDAPALVVDVVVDQLAQTERTRHPVDERDHVHPERGLHRGFLVEVVENDLGRRPGALQLDHEPHAGAVRLIAQVRDPVQLLLPHEIGDLGD